jgi:hypothetical protein
VLALVLTALIGEAAWRLLERESPAAAAMPRHFDRSRYFYVPEPGREHPWAGESPGLRVAVIGDSITLGAAVQPHDRYGQRLESLLNLNEGVPPARVTVHALAGSSTFQQVRLLSEALAEGVDLVVLGICANDTEDWTRTEEFLAWRAEAIPRVVPAPLRWSRLLCWAFRKKEALRSAAAHRDYYRHLYDPDYSGWTRFNAGLAAFADACRDADVDLVAVVFPLFSWDLDPETYPFAFVRQAILSALQEHEIPTLDLWDHYQGMEPLRLEAIPRIDAHPNEIAHRIAAEALYQFLLDEKIIDPAYHARHHWSQIDYWAAVRAMMESRARSQEPPPQPK